MPRTSRRSSEDYDDRYSSEDRPRRRSRRSYDEDYDSSRSSSRRTPPRDEYGQFLSEDEDDSDYEGGSRRGSRYSSSSSRGHGGWFGDPEGHSRAAREGWGEDEGDYGSSRSRRSRSSRYDEDEDEDSYSSGSRGGRSSRRLSAASRGRGHGGWFGDPEGHSEAAREGWDNPGHGPSGWYGDEEGHREAAERGWEHGHRGQRRRRAG